jgi:hypothetical protein
MYIWGFRAKALHGVHYRVRSTQGSKTKLRTKHEDLVMEGILPKYGLSFLPILPAGKAIVQSREDKIIADYNPA